jgi:hypothetical protein
MPVDLTAKMREKLQVLYTDVMHVDGHKFLVSIGLCGCIIEGCCSFYTKSHRTKMQCFRSRGWNDERTVVIRHIFLFVHMWEAPIISEGGGHIRTQYACDQ